ncbi:Acyl carrier protein [Buchnera aphidicola (Chaitophorus sp. 3695)]|uniref:acyl carrier protein n=1 Tax=Buchnera aphidicola TaxID=9 RepID=UPI0034646AB6
MDLKTKIKKIILNCLSLKKKISDHSCIKNDLKADSLDMIELIMSIEENFNINIKDKEAENITTVYSLINLVKKKIKK